MGILKRIAGFLGFFKDEGHEPRDEDDDDEDLNNHDYRENNEGVGNYRKGFSVPVSATVDRAHIGPVLIPCSYGDGGLQGLWWYAKRLRVDEDGDVADEFLVEVKTSEKAYTEDPRRSFPRFELKCSTRSAKVRCQVMSKDGEIQHCIEQQGRLLWV